MECQLSEFISIEVASELLGVCKQTLRRWDESGKLTAQRSDGGYRQYSLGDIQAHMPGGKAKPFVKWAGGKSQLLAEILPRVPNNYTSYIEPFLGGGALFFALQPISAKLNDINEELINTYTQVRDNPFDTLEILHKLEKKHCKEHYYTTRAKSPSRMSPLNRASRFIYLNKTCFNGLHRVNQKGEFNVPMGSYKNPRIADDKNIIACSKALQNAELFSMCYSDFIKEHADKNSFIYLDPPYAPASESSDFDRYASGKFRIGDQLDLALLFSELVDSKSLPLLSNSSTDLTQKLYSDFKLETIQASRFINNKGNKRGKVEEIIVSPIREKEQTFPSTRYMGSKNSLLPYINQVLKDEPRGSVLDAFSGSGVVSYHLKKMGFEVHSNDFLAYSSAVSAALVENNEITLPASDINFLLSSNRKAKKFIRTTFKDLYFSDEDNKFLDNTIANIEEIGCRLKRSIALSALSRACLKRRPRGIFTYVGFKYDDGRKDLSFSLKEHFTFAIHEFNKAVFSNNRLNKSYNSSALALDIEKPDIVYLDPPYFSLHSDNDYVRRYHFIEGLCRNWRGVEIQEHTKTKKFKKYPSPFDTKAGTYEALEALFEKYKKSKFLMSYSSNCLPDKHEITSMLEAVGKKVSLLEIDYKYSFGNQGHKVKSNNNDVFEYLFFAQ
jgi:DNA adenine methylase